jgi:putative tryptophan/tyrosine transport system substrate-binding protein
MEEATGAPSSSTVYDPRRLRASGRDGGGVMNRPPSPLTMLLSRHTRRREFIAGLGGAAVWSLVARAQQPGRLVSIGYMGPVTQSAESRWIAAFGQRLRELGWIDGRTVAITYRWAEGRNERYREIAAEFLQLKVDVIVTAGTPAILAAQQATSGIPVVFAAAGDPVANGLVERFARPGGNVTGLSGGPPELAGKRIELLREVVTGLRRLAIMDNAGNPQSRLEIDEGQAAARTLGLEVTLWEIRKAEDIAPAFEELKGRPEALYVLADPLTHTNRVLINTLALAARLPCTVSGTSSKPGA